jgi:carbamoyltransferase
MNHWGINALNHGSSISVINNGRYMDSCVSNFDQIPHEQIRRNLELYGAPDRIFWYERPWIKKARQLYAGQYKSAFNLSVLPSVKLKEWGLGYADIQYTSHHASHAAAGYYTSPFNHCAIVVIDAIGEFECVTIWDHMVK